MFTGLIEETGTIISTEIRGTSRRIRIKAQKVLQDISVDDSISVNGACQTVVKCTSHDFEVDSVQETLLKTTLGSLKAGDSINLERAMKIGGRLGGHIVQGHVDCIAKVANISIVDGGGWQLWIEFPAQYQKYIVPVGSVCINGVSLTVARVHNNSFMSAIIPHTLSNTTIGLLKVHMTVNIEFDILAKYIENMMHFSHTDQAEKSSVLNQYIDQPL